ncbi:hypothetical protein HMPREF1619_02569 [Klebsiella pneumoniae 909957]|nr:hypothetical protein HMPREF1619_02569 [Klebsiella pneumoniae 909957]
MQANFDYFCFPALLVFLGFFNATECEVSLSRRNRRPSLVYLITIVTIIMQRLRWCS